MYTGIKVLMLGAVTIFIALIHNANSAILIPEEVPTLTMIAYSLLPPVKLGQDSRLGFGFRLGRNADAQVLVELGPQTNTATLGESSPKRQSSSNRSPASLDREQRIQAWKNIVKSREKAGSSIDSTITKEPTGS